MLQNAETISNKREEKNEKRRRIVRGKRSVEREREIEIKIVLSNIFEGNL